MTKELREMVRKTIAFMKCHPWSQKSIARDVHGNACSEFSKKAYSFCAMGAFIEANISNTNNLPNTTPFIKAFSNKYGVWPYQFNDAPGRKKKEVIAALEGMLVE